MKNAKKLVNLLVPFALSANLSVSNADINIDADSVFNWAEGAFTQLFPSHSATQSMDVWLFRYYPATGIYAGVNTKDSSVWVKGGGFGDDPKFIDSLANVLKSTGAQSAATVCDASKSPQGFSFSQSGSTVTVSTGNQCVAVPQGPVCVPANATANGVSVLSRSNVTSHSLEGIVLKDPKLEPLVTSAINVKTCQKNVPESFVNQTVNLDACFDVTDSLSAYSQYSALFTVTPPARIKMQSTFDNQVVDDCFKTDAKFVTDALTNELWEKQNGSFVKIR